MKIIFEISQAGIDVEKCHLICEVSSECFSYAIRDEEKNMYVAVAVYSFDKLNSFEDNGNELDEVLQKEPLLPGNFKKVCVIYSFAESELIPFSLYNSAENDNVLNLVHGDINDGTITITDIIAEKKSYNTYRVPASILRVISAKFPNAETTHQYSLSLKQTVMDGNKLFIIFYAQKIVVTLIKNGQIAFINNFYYTTPEDMSYVLLNICRQHEVNNPTIEVSGLIEKNSVLYRELYKYFEHIYFAKLPAKYNYSEEISQHPSHYFSHIFAIDSCE